MTTVKDGKKIKKKKSVLKSRLSLIFGFHLRQNVSKFLSQGNRLCMKMLQLFQLTGMEIENFQKKKKIFEKQLTL